MPASSLTFTSTVLFGLILCCILSLICSAPSDSIEPQSLSPDKAEVAKKADSNQKPTSHQFRMAADSPVQQTDEREQRRQQRHKNKNNQFVEERCAEKTGEELREMLGAAFNGRYMSMLKPTNNEAIIVSEDQPLDVQSDGSIKTGDSRILPFHVEPHYKRELPPDFYWDISWYQEVIRQIPETVARLLRTVRSVAMDSDEVNDQSEKGLPWQCESEIIWTDLGENYYPRYLRNVRCTRENCWFGHFKCRPKAFTVNVLKRVRDSCKDDLYDQEWVYEERAVTFCCECVEH